MQVRIKESPVHGRGLFADDDIPKDTPICLLCWWHEHEMWWRVNENSVAPMVNHSYEHCNLIPVLNEDINQYVIYTTKDIKGGSELFLNYDDNPSGLMKATDYNPPLR